MKPVPRIAQLSVIILLAACSPSEDARAEGGFQSDQDKIEIVSTNVQGKNVYIPGTIVVVAGKPHTLSLFNTTDTPHGFSIGGLGIEEVLLSKVEHEVRLPPLEGGKIYRIHCQLHPPHRSATLVVLPAGD